MDGVRCLTDSCLLDAEHYREGLEDGIMTGIVHWNGRDPTEIGFKLKKPCVANKSGNCSGQT